MNGVKRIIRKVVNALGYEVSRLPQRAGAARNGTSREVVLGSEKPMETGEYGNWLRSLGVDKANYGCGFNLLGPGWVNIDRWLEWGDRTKTYVGTDLTARHPFPSGFFRLSFAEDFLEHLDQPGSIVFLCESYRTLQPGGVLRLSFPGLQGVLRKHYRSSDYEGASTGQREAYTLWEHRHFYCEESLCLVGRHIGFSTVEFVQYGESVHDGLRGLDTRADQRGLNIYAELTK